MESRAYSLLEIKGIDEGLRQITGIASTPAPDRSDDIVEPKGAEFNLPIPLLWQHDHGSPIGNVVSAKVTSKGIEVVAEIAKGVSGEIDRAWELIKSGLVRGLSIGFRGLETEEIKGSKWGVRFIKWEWLELSAVTIPANAEASITSLKKFDTEQRAASGQSLSDDDSGNSANGASADEMTTRKGVKINPKKEAEMSVKTYSEQISDLEATRAAATVKMKSLADASTENGETFDDAQKEEFDTLAVEIKEVEGQMARLKTLQDMDIKTAKPVEDANSQEKAVEIRKGAVITTNRNLEKGIGFSRYAMALAVSKGSTMQAAEFSKKWDDTPEVESVLKAAVAAGTTTDPTWAAPLVDYQNLTSEFIEFLRPKTIVGQIQGLVRVPFNVRIAGQTSGGSASWVGEGLAKPVTSFEFNNVQLGMAKIAAIVVQTEELMRSSNPASETVFRNTLADTIVQKLNEDFLDPTVAAVANVSPSSVTNGQPTFVASGTDMDALKADVEKQFEAMITATKSLSNCYFIMTEIQAARIAMMKNPLGQTEYTGMTLGGNQSGGSFMGFPVIVSESAGSGQITLLKSDEIFLADDDQVMIDVSSEATVEMEDSPTGDTTKFVSLWQNNLVGLRAERFLNWQLRRPGAVNYITGAAYR